MSQGQRRHIWLVADDYGISPAVSAAIRDLIVRGRINATSVMMNAPSLSPDEIVRLLDAAGSQRGGKTHAAIGLHLTLTAPYRPLSQNFSPLRNGAFPPLAAMAGRALGRRLKPDRLDAEIASQFAAFAAAFGRAPDYVDGHQHIHLFPQVREAVLRVTRAAAPQAWARQCGRMGPALKRLTDRKALVLDRLSRRFRRMADACGVPTNPAFAGTYSFRTRSEYAKLFAAFLDGLPDGGLIMCHPGTVDAELVRLDPLTKLREREYAFFGGDSFPQLLAAHGVTLEANPD